MKLSVERKPESIVVLDITADDAEFQEAIKVAVRKVSKTIQVPGFRKGKAPRAIIERYYGPTVFLQEAADESMEKLYRQALQQEDLQPVGEPKVEINSFEPLNFTVEVAVYPTAELGDYSGIRVEPFDAAVTEEEIDEVITRLQRTQSPWADPSEPRPAQDGDQVTVDYDVFDGETPFQDPVTDAVFVLGETNLLPAFYEQLVGVNVGDEKAFDIAFATDDPSVDPSIQGKTLSYKLTVKGIKERDLLPIDDEFAKTVADAETLEELRTEIRNDIHSGKTGDGRNLVLNQILDKLAETSNLELPHELVHDELHHQLEHLHQDVTRNGTPWEAYLASQGMTADQLHDSLWPQAEARLRNSLLMQAFAQAEGIEVTDEDIDAEIEKLIAQNPGAVTGDQAEENAARLREIYKGDYFRNMLSNDIFQRNVTDRLLDLATEGRGAVLNAYVAPEPEAVDIDTAIEAAGALAAEAEAEYAHDHDHDHDHHGHDHAPHDHSHAHADEDVIDTTATDVEATAETTEDVATEAEAPKSTATRTKKLGPADREGTDWIPGTGEKDAPAEFPIKGNGSSKIYHPIESPFYEATIAEVFFANAEAAEAAGYRLPKALQNAGAAAADTAKSAAEAALDAVKGE